MLRALLEAHTPPEAGSTSLPAAQEAQLPYKPQSVGQARRLVREALTAWGLGHLIDTAALVTSELVTNAAKTGCQLLMTVTVERIAKATVRVSVRDGSRALPVLIQASDDDEGHRGLSLVHRLTGGRWGVTVEPLGKVVHADIAR
ncbi:ATP-binding protein [Streptomyces sp. CB01881]|uniref:ATP-binding protein n=1 Tax=Streptomyces sp. CB01881 TaxID=2078691 RepID=UPI000CDC758B|nr:ATP-binding protein [Streptomyces sp. CB01881]AUY49744.1 ATP-binding protein [Streptomyces sp. CB01881]TYC73134.1 ATP-binding protein [Streptomyces sp. CB01881]